MLGHTHALTGAAVGAAAGLYVAHTPPATTAGLAVLTAGFAVLPDLDHRGTCAARSLGLVSAAFAWLVERVSGGHRHGTHSIIGAAVFTGLAWAVVAAHEPWGRWVIAVLAALALAAGLRALRIGGHVADAVAALVAGAAAAWTGLGAAVVPVACGLGWAIHIAGDMLTDRGCPLLWPFTMRHYRFWPEPFAFTTGTAPERWLVTPASVVALGWLSWHAAGVFHL